MSCHMQNLRFEPIADEIVDKSLALYPYHTIITHLGCIFIRSAIGLTLMSKHLQKNTLNTLSIIVLISILLFGFKYLYYIYSNDIILWKSYPRMLIAYSIALYLMRSNQESLAGVVIIIDALIGLQSRHTASAVTCGMKKRTS